MGCQHTISLSPSGQPAGTAATSQSVSLSPPERFPCVHRLESRLHTHRDPACTLPIERHASAAPGEEQALWVTRAIRVAALRADAGPPERSGAAAAPRHLLHLLAAVAPQQAAQVGLRVRAPAPDRPEGRPAHRWALSLLCLPMLPVTAPVASRSLQEGLPAGTSFLLRGVVCHLGCQVVRGSARNACCRVAQ